MINKIVGVIVGTVQNIRVEAVRIENVLILDGQYHHTSAYLVLGNLQTEYLLFRESQFRNHKYISVVLLNLRVLFMENTGVSSMVCELVAFVSFLSVSFTLISSMSYAILVLFFSV